LKIKAKIGTKLFVTYVLLLVITLSLTLFIFGVLSQRYLISETKQQLRLEANIILEVFKNRPLTDLSVREQLENRVKIQVANRLIEANVIVLNQNRKIIYSNTNISDTKELARLVNMLDNQEYISVRVPITNTNQSLKGTVLVFTKLKDVKNLNNLMHNTLFLSFGIAGFVALIIGFIIERSITRPLKKLRDVMSNYSLKSPLEEYKIITGDEIEELSISFQQMSSKLVAYDEQQKRFLQNTSHELKTPLMAIQGNAEAIKERVVEGEEMEQSLEVIISESQRLKKVVDEIIFLTKLESINENFAFAKNNLTEIVNKAVKSLKSLAKKDSINIVANNNQILVGDYDFEKLTRALVNIIGNCIRYAKSQVAIEVSDKGYEVEILIKDDGVGFQEGEERRIFERFYKGKKGGTGIGLSIAKIVIEGHQGTIEAYNNPYGGAVFKILLPKAKSPE